MHTRGLDLENSSAQSSIADQQASATRTYGVEYARQALDDLLRQLHVSQMVHIAVGTLGSLSASPAGSRHLSLLTSSPLDLAVNMRYLHI